MTIALLLTWLTGPGLLLTSPASPLPLVSLASAIRGAGPLTHITSLASAIGGAGRTLSPAVVSSPRSQVGGVSPLLLLSGVLGRACPVLVVVRVLAVVIVILIVPRHNSRLTLNN